MTDPRLQGLLAAVPGLHLKTEPGDLEHYGRDWTRRWSTRSRPGSPPTATGPGGHTQRLLTVVKSGSIQEVKAAPIDKVIAYVDAATPIKSVDAILLIGQCSHNFGSFALALAAFA